MMQPHELVASLRVYATASAQAAQLDGTPIDGKARLNFMASLLLEAADQIVLLQDRLVRQACYLETIEAEHAPRFPLLDDDDAGAAL